MKHKHIRSSRAGGFALSLAILVIGGATSLAQTDVSDADLQAARQRFDAAAQHASAITQRSAQLESRLRFYADKVQTAKQNVSELTAKKRDIRMQIAANNELIEALKLQLDALHDEQMFHTSLIEAQKDDFVEFVRYIALQDMVVDETGPAAGGEVMHRLLRGSLGDIVADGLHRSAVLRAREKLLSKLTILIAEGDSAKQRLQLVAEDLSGRINDLETMYHNIDMELDGDLHAIEADSHARELTEEELHYIKQQMAEEQARLMEMQGQMAQIQSRLKAHKSEQVEKKIEEFSDQIVALENQKKDLIGQREYLISLQEEAKIAFKKMKEQKSTDRKFYQRVNALELELENTQARLKTVEAVLAGPKIENMRAYAIEKDDLLASIPKLEVLLTYVRDGYPEDAAKNYSEKQAKAKDAEARVYGVDERMKLIDGDRLRLTEKLSKAEQELKDVESMPIIGIFGDRAFIWPVKGRITAGFYDAAYEQHFGVPHKAIDIATQQGTPVYAIADGVVYTVKDGGAKGYSYILLGHGNGYGSLYGHMSKFFVAKGQVVEQGQVIGLSGGKPGTPGAGWMTTGPHLHLEVTRNGKHINPLSILGKKMSEIDE